MKKYVINYERIEDGWWLATVEGLRGCLTQGRTIKQSRERIREALSLFVDDASTADLIDNIRLSAKARRAVNKFKAARQRATDQAIKLQDAANKTASALIEGMGLSMRDTAELLGLSHQRIHQIFHTENVISVSKEE